MAKTSHYEGSLREWESFGEEPLGDEVEVAYIGWTREFSPHQMQVAQGMAARNVKSGGFLDYHVPLNMRGKYLVGDYGPQLGEKVDAGGYAICTGTTSFQPKRGAHANNRPCRARASNHSGRCANHGGALNPLDRKQIDWSRAPREVRWHYGKLPMEELDDEELAKGQLRLADGTFTQARFVPATMHDQMVKRLFERADQKMREGLMDMVDTMMDIARGDAYEPADRLRAAEFVFKWLRGNQPVRVEIGVDKPFEQLIGAVMKGGSRSESRAARGLEDDTLDAEVVEDLDLPELEKGENNTILTVEHEDEETYDYTDPRDKTLYTDLQPKPVVHIGEAGKPHTDIPRKPEERMAHWERHDENVEEAELRKDKVFKKRPKTAEEIAQDRKDHKDQMKKGIAKRKAFINMGHDSLPKPLNIDLISVVNEEGSSVPLAEIEEDEDLYDGDAAIFRVDVERIRD